MFIQQKLIVEYKIGSVYRIAGKSMVCLKIETSMHGAIIEFAEIEEAKIDDGKAVKVPPFWAEP